jgi:hypothetical protein
MGDVNGDRQADLVIWVLTEPGVALVAGDSACRARGGRRVVAIAAWPIKLPQFSQSKAPPYALVCPTLLALADV